MAPKARRWTKGYKAPQADSNSPMARCHSRRLYGPEAMMRDTIECLLSLPEEEQHKMELATEYTFTMKSPPPKYQSHQDQMQQVMVTLNTGAVEAASALCQQKLRPAVLNFAHSYNCGGGFEHSGGSQEEDIFRKTSVFLSLWPHRRMDDGPGVLKRGMWIGDYDKELPRKEPFYPHTECGGIYSPHVRIVRNLQREGELLPGNDIADAAIVAVLTVAAQNVGREPPFRKDLLVQKARAALHMAAENGHDAVVLGAFGCGYFNNPPECVAGVFQRLLCTEFASAFRIVVFAIPDRAGPNLTSFTQFFPLESCRGLARALAADEEKCSVEGLVSNTDRSDGSSNHGRSSASGKGSQLGKIDVDIAC